MRKWIPRVGWTYNAFLIFFLTIPAYQTGTPISGGMAALYIGTSFALALEAWRNDDA